MRQGPPQGVYTYRNRTTAVMLVVLIILTVACETGLLFILRRNGLLVVSLSTAYIGFTCGYLFLRYNNSLVKIGADAVEAVSPLKKITRIRYEDISAVDLRQTGRDGPLAVVRSRNAKIAVQKGINDWPRLKEALESLKPSGTS